MKQFVLVFVLVTGSVMGREWDHVSGVCNTKEERSNILRIAHVDNTQLHSIGKIREREIDIITFDVATDALFDALKDDYAHFYLGKSEWGTVCIASKYSIDPSFIVSKDGERFESSMVSSFDAICYLAKDKKEEKNENHSEGPVYTTKKTKLEISAKADHEGNITIEGKGQYKEEDKNSTTEVSGAISVSIDENGNPSGEVKLTIDTSY